MLQEIRECFIDNDARSLDNPDDCIAVLVPIMKVCGFPHVRLLEEVLQSPYCEHYDCAGPLCFRAPSRWFVGRYPGRFEWRCDECGATTVVDVEVGRRWTEPVDTRW